MKKKLLVLIALLLVLTGCSSLFAGSPVNYVSPEEVIGRFDAGDTFAFIIGDATCPACNQYMKGAQAEFKKKDDVVLDYVDLNKLTEMELEYARKLVTDYLNNDFEATPTTYFIINGKLSEFKVGVIDYDTLSSTYDELIK